MNKKEFSTPSVVIYTNLPPLFAIINDNLMPDFDKCSLWHPVLIKLGLEIIYLCTINEINTLLYLYLQIIHTLTPDLTLLTLKDVGFCFYKNAYSNENWFWGTVTNLACTTTCTSISIKHCPKGYWVRGIKFFKTKDHFFSRGDN